MGDLAGCGGCRQFLCISSRVSQETGLISAYKTVWTILSNYYNCSGGHGDRSGFRGLGLAGPF